MVNNFHRFIGKVAIVIGSSYGIGYTVAQRLAVEGAKVIIASRKKEHVDAATNQLQSEGLNVTGVTCHVSHEKERTMLFKEAQRLGGLDILMVNAGVNPSYTPILDVPETAWDKSFDVNVKAPFLICKEALPLLKESQSGRIIFMSSVGAFSHKQELAVYSVSKLALLGLTKFLALQLAPYNITVNSVVPGAINTQFAKIFSANETDRELILQSIPLKRYGTTEEVSNVITFLASDESSYITGENIVISGGLASRI